MSLYNFLDYNVFLPLGDLIYGSCVKRKLKELRRTDKLSAAELRQLQNDKLRRLVKHCYETVPYYTRLFNSLGLTAADIQTVDDLPKLPVLTKQIIRDNYEDMFSTAIPRKEMRSMSSGGSTGIPLKYYTSREGWSSWKASTLRAWEWYGVKLGDSVFSLGGGSINKTTKALSFKGLYDRVIMRNHKFNSRMMEESDLQYYYDCLCRMRPKALRGYPSALYAFACFLERKQLQLQLPKISCVLTTAEVLLPEYRRKMASVFHAPVFDAYGAGDGGVLSHECLAHNGMHLSEELCVVEIVNLQSDRVPDGTTGFVCSTDLENYAFPFIRYQVGDMAYINAKECDCGRKSRLIGEVMGRCGKLVYNKNGLALSPATLDNMLYPNLDFQSPQNQLVYNKIDKFQIEQDEEGDIVIRIVGKPDSQREDFLYIKKNYQDFFIGSNVELEFVDSIPCLPSGKEDYCISRYTKYN